MGSSEWALSIIIPVYNAQKTIVDCIESAIKQKCDIEIIVVDDGSVDSTKDIVLEMSKKYKNVFYYYKENEGVASARNFGMKMASGKYITFIDQDDWVEENSYNELILMMECEAADMMVYGYSKDYENACIQMKNLEIIPTKIYSMEALIKYAFHRETYRAFAAFVWNKIFKKEFLDNNNIHFDMTLKRGDDVLFFSEVAICEPLTLFVSKSIYHYTQRKDSITHTLTKDNLHRLMDILIGYERAIKAIEIRDCRSKAVNYMKSFYVYHASLLYEIAVQVSDTVREKILVDSMNKYYCEYCKQNSHYPERIDRINRLLER